jgi:hypothetical protein
MTSGISSQDLSQEVVVVSRVVDITVGEDFCRVFV